jgi:branched-chain amino acid transport system permease protein
VASRIGRAWVAIREDEMAASAVGINTTSAKLWAFAIGASFSGFAGSLFAALQGAVFPNTFLFTQSILVVAMVIGGMGTPGAADRGGGRLCSSSSATSEHPLRVVGPSSSCS